MEDYKNNFKQARERLMEANELIAALEADVKRHKEVLARVYDALCAPGHRNDKIGLWAEVRDLLEAK